MSLQQAEITGIVLTEQYSSLPAVVHSASYPPGKANRVAVVSGSDTGLTNLSRKSFAYIQVVAFRSGI